MSHYGYTCPGESRGVGKEQLFRIGSEENRGVREEVRAGML